MSREAMIAGYFAGYMNSQSRFEKVAAEDSWWDKVKNTWNTDDGVWDKIKNTWNKNLTEDQRNYITGAGIGGVTGATIGGLSGGVPGAVGGGFAGATVLPAAMYGYNKMVRDPQVDLQSKLSKSESEKSGLEQTMAEKLKAADAKHQTQLGEADAAKQALKEQLEALSSKNKNITSRMDQANEDTGVLMSLQQADDNAIATSKNVNDKIKALTSAIANDTKAIQSMQKIKPGTGSTEIPGDLYSKAGALFTSGQGTSNQARMDKVKAIVERTKARIDKNKRQLQLIQALQPAAK